MISVRACGQRRLRGTRYEPLDPSGDWLRDVVGSLGDLRKLRRKIGGSRCPPTLCHRCHAVALPPGPRGWPPPEPPPVAHARRGRGGSWRLGQRRLRPAASPVFNMAVYGDTDAGLQSSAISPTRTPDHRYPRRLEPAPGHGDVRSRGQQGKPGNYPATQRLSVAHDRGKLGEHLAPRPRNRIVRDPRQFSRQWVARKACRCWQSPSFPGSHVLVMKRGKRPISPALHPGAANGLGLRGSSEPARNLLDQVIGTI